jgi:PPK2 family polyphosphate:nucleotide phosphotransferase
MFLLGADYRPAFRKVENRTMADSTNKSGILDASTLKRIRVEPDKKIRLKDHDPKWTLRHELGTGSEEAVKEQSKKILQENLNRLARAQELLYASGTHAVLIVLQAMDAAGKDGTIKHVMSGVNPQGCRVSSFKSPSPEELAHDFLWREAKSLPARGQIGIFNRSHYEEVLVTKVHPELLARQHLDIGKVNKKFWKQRYQDINSFERHLARNGTVILKFFLHMSKEAQKTRFLERLEDPKKFWKFSLADMAERQYWKSYMKAYEEALSETSTSWAPWYVIPADHKWSARVLVAEVIEGAIGALHLKNPEPSEEQVRQIKKAKAALMSKE